MQIVVLGAGVIGVSTAYYLTRAGHTVTVVDRADAAAMETSFANGGQISATHAIPWANPGAIGQALRWLGRSDAPLLFRLRADPDQWRWAFRFIANCSSRRTRENTEKIIRLASYSREEIKRLRQFTGLQYDVQERGILHIYRDAGAYDAAKQSAAMLREFGLQQDLMGAEDCIDLEPALQSASTDLVGGIYCPDDESGDAHRFTQGLAAIAKSEGCDFRFNTRILGLRHQDNRVEAVRTEAGDINADAIVLALGSYSTPFMKPYGLHLPIYPTKGYSATLPVVDTAKTPTVSMIDDAHKIVYSRLGERLRVAGTAEFNGYNLDLDPIRCAAVRDHALKLFPGAVDGDKAAFWCGLRPSTPDGAPILGKARFDNLYLNTGHGTLGWTMACGSGRVITDMIAGKVPDISLRGLTAERFR